MLLLCLGIWVSCIAWALCQERLAAGTYGGERFANILFLNAVVAAAAATTGAVAAAAMVPVQ